MNYDLNGQRHRFVYGSWVEESAVSNQVAIVYSLFYFESLVGPAVFAISCVPFRVIF